MHSMSTCGRRGDHIWRDVNAVGHHDDDAASVLGTVQGSALRSDRACARPSGLDGACAQIAGRQLRDGRRTFFPSGAHGTLIDPVDGLEGCSPVSMVSPDTCAASAPSRSFFAISIVDGCCERRYSVRIRLVLHAPASAIGYRRGAVVDRRLKGRDQQLPGTSRETIGDAHVDHLVGPRRRLLTEHLTRGPHAEASIAGLVIVGTARPTS